MSGPCGWVVDRCGCGTCWDGYTPAVREQAAALASYVLWSATGRRYGPCEATVLPCNPPAPYPLYRTYPVAWPGYALSDDLYGVYPVLAGGQWYNTACGGTCSCCQVACGCQVPLPGPIHSIVEVRLNGSTVDPSAYVVTDKSRLVRVDGSCWPTCQTAGLQIPTFEVDYNRGLGVPEPVAGAARVLACEYAKLCSGGECTLPMQLRSLSRSGVTVDLETPITGVKPGSARHIITGIATVDQVILADNPHSLTSPRVVVSPDEPVPRQVTWRAAS